MIKLFTDSLRPNGTPLQTELKFPMKLEALMALGYTLADATVMLEMFDVNLPTSQRLTERRNRSLCSNI